MRDPVNEVEANHRTSGLDLLACGKRYQSLLVDSLYYNLKQRMMY